MTALTAADFDLAAVIASLAAAGAAILGVAIAKYGWRSVVGFFGK